MNISQVAKKFNLTAATLRYYEKVGLIPSVNRKESGVRDYTEEDINWIDFIKCMRSAGLTIESLIAYTSLFFEGEKTVEARKNILVEERNKMIEKQREMEETIRKLDKKIENYNGILLKKEAELEEQLTKKKIRS